MKFNVNRIANGFVVVVLEDQPGNGSPDPFYFTSEDEVAAFIKKTITKKPKVVRIKKEHLEKLAQPQIN